MLILCSCVCLIARHASRDRPHLVSFQSALALSTLGLALACRAETMLRLSGHVLCCSYKEDDDSVLIQFTSRPAVRAKLLIGADGTTSSVRQQCRSDDQLYHAVSVC